MHQHHATTSFTERALFHRVKRRMFAEERVILRICRENSRWFSDLGRYYAHDERNTLTHAHIDLAGLAREIGVIKSGEALAV